MSGDDVSRKAEKEAEIDRKMAEIRKKNQAILARQQVLSQWCSVCVGR